MKDKRRLINQLPAVFQTDTLKNFFAATLDQLVQPGSSEQISGYIGQKPVYNNPLQDFYISEPTDARQAYQLEPGMVSIDNTNTVSASLSYDDLLNYIGSQGGLTNNHSRLFEGDYYSWVPPVDIDKLNNYSQYIWLGALSSTEHAQTQIVLRSPANNYSYDGVETVYPLPPVIPEISVQDEYPVVLANGRRIDAHFDSSGNATISEEYVKSGDIITTIRYGDISKIVSGKTSFNFNKLNHWTSYTNGFRNEYNMTGTTGSVQLFVNGEAISNVVDFNTTIIQTVYDLISDVNSNIRGLYKLNSLSSGKFSINISDENVTIEASDDISISLDSVSPIMYHFKTYKIGDLVYSVDEKAAYRCIVNHIASGNFSNEKANWVIATDAQNLTTGMRIKTIDGLGVRQFMVDGVGSSIVLCDDNTFSTNGTYPLYTVIDRRSQEKSPWAIRNAWVHLNSLTWNGIDYSRSIRKARRPIIEFLPNIQLHNYGWNRLPDVQAIMSNTVAVVYDNWDIYPYDTNVWDNGQVVLSRINGQLFGRQYDNKYDNSGKISNSVVGSVSVDNGYILQPNDYLFVKQNNSLEPRLNNLIYKVVLQPNTPISFNATAEVIQLTLTGTPQRGDIFKYISGNSNFDIFTPYIEYWYNGVEWVVAQSASTSPLFSLYDSDQNRLDDQNTYPGSNFSGNKLFSYQVGAGVNDSILGFPLNYDSYGNPIFNVDSDIEVVTYNGGNIEGYYYQKIISNEVINGVSNYVEKYSNNWFPHYSKSNQVLTNGVYSIPLNLQANPNNLQIKTISKSQWFDHFSEIMVSQKDFKGHPYTANNWRDTSKKLSLGTKILQHRSPLLKTMLVSSLSTYDVPSSIRYAEQEYIRYKNKFVQALISIRQSGDLIDNDPDSLWVQKALDQLKLNKTSDFAFYGSSMGGSTYFIPPTPASMGLSSVAKPSLVYDYSYSTPILMIKGHDGSLSPAFGDWRDSKILAFEQKIYNNIPEKFKTESRPLVDLYANINSAFYDGGELNYSQSEINKILAPYFEKWAQLNKMDYSINNTYVSDDPFSWNYSGTFDVNGNALPGFWKGIYYLYYNTDRPHLAPWEMLGFVDKPLWWNTEYGPSPYTRGNKKLWNDLRDGRIRNGIRAGIDLAYARAELYRFLPVDDEGNLLDPRAAKIVEDIPTYNYASAPWKFGDGSPIESLWRRSISFQFSWAIATFLAKPSRFIEQGWDTINNIQDSAGQWIYNLTGNRPQNKQLYVHGEIVNNSYIKNLGVQQWISDYITSMGQNPQKFGNHIRGLDVRLMHKLAGFTTTDNLSIISDNFGKLPSENIKIDLYNSPSIRESFYSGVLVEKVDKGWKVVGYDIRNPNFTIIPPMKNGPTGIISLSDLQEPVVSAWRPNTYYTINSFVQYQTSVYEATKSHMGGNILDITYWKNSGISPPSSPKVTTYLYGTDEELVIPYGTIFNNYQEIADFLLGHERYLVSQGWSFTNIDPAYQNTIDWSTATEEFLAWSQVNWATGNFITLSPGAAGISFDAKHGYIFDILRPITGEYGVINRTGSPIDRKDVVVNRIDNTATIYSKNNDLYGIRVNVGQIEHILIFDNITIFGNLIYDPLFNLRQPRLLIIGNKSTNWTGIFDAPGYVLIDGEIKSNFDKSSNDLLTMWDIEKSDNAVLREYARSVTGYDSRNYLENLVISPTQQFEYYQGLIHQKGASGAFNKLLRSDYIDQNRQLSFFEEWAFRIDEYGALSSKDRVSVQIRQPEVLRNPQYIQFNVTQNAIVNNYDNVDWINVNDSVTDGIDGSWVERSKNPLTTFAKRDDFQKKEQDFPVSGYVRLDEINYSVFYGSDVPFLYNTAINHRMYDGEVVWVHENIKTVNIGNASNTWYVIGNFVQNTASSLESSGALGYWDGTVQTAAVQSSYLFTDSSGNTVFQSKVNDAPFITNTLDFIPIAGQTYSMTFTVKKVSQETNGIPAYIIPAFDGFDDYNIYMQLTATTTGNGYDPVLDLIDTTNWALDTYYNLTVNWTCPDTPIFNAVHSRLRLNHNGMPDYMESVYSNAVFEVLGQNIISQQKLINWDALKIYNMSTDGSENYVSNVVTYNEEKTLSTDSIRIHTLNPHGLSSIDINNFLVIDGSTFSNENMAGIHTISAVGPTFFEIKASSVVGFDFIKNTNTPMPPVRIMRSVHFNNFTEFDVMKTSRNNIKAGDYAYVDGNANEPWSVYKAEDYTEQQSDFEGNIVEVNYIVWNCYREQPKRIDASKISSTVLYSLESKINNYDLRAQPSILDNLNIVSPLCGILPGVAINQLDYITDYDPAQYPYSPSADVLYSLDSTTQSMFNNSEVANAFGGFGDINGWGPESVGKLWWDLSTVRFLETETDDVTYGMVSDEKYNSEVKYRIENWGSIAPASSIDIYQWVRSIVDPITYQLYSDTKTGNYTGNVYKSINPSYSSFEERDPISGQIYTYYYFWVSGLTTTSLNTNKTMSPLTISRYLVNPTIEDEPWFAPIMQNGLLIGGANAFLQDSFSKSTTGTLSGTVIQMILDKTEYQGTTHQDWMLLRPHDPRSLPPNWMWDNLRDSLVGFDDRKNPKPKSKPLPRPLPNLNLPPIWNPPTPIKQPPIAPSLDDGFLDDDIYTRPR